MAYVDKMQALEICENYSQHCFDTNNSQGQQVADDILDEILELDSLFWWRNSKIKLPTVNNYYLCYYKTIDSDIWFMSSLYWKDGLWSSSNINEIIEEVAFWTDLPETPSLYMFYHTNKK